MGNDIVEIKKKIRGLFRGGNITKRVLDQLYETVMKKVARARIEDWSRKYEVIPNQIMFYTFQGKYTCNLKYITEEIMKEGLDLKLVWVSRFNKQEGFPDSIIQVKRFTFAYYKALCQSKILIGNGFDYARSAICKKKEQVYIETWHGSLGIKKLDVDNVSRKNKVGSEIVDVAISNSDFEDDIFRNTYFGNARIMKLGHARNDILVNTKEDVISNLNAAIRKEYEIPNNTKLILFGPTRRGYEEERDLDPNELIKACEAKYGCEFVLLVRAHSHEKYATHTQKSLKVIDVTDYPDIQELMVVADIGITDYSSWIFDYMLTRKPGFIYAPDIREYDSYRGFYYPLEETPFPIARDNEELKNNIKEFDFENYKRNVETFLNGKGCIDDGNSSARIVNYIRGIIDDGKRNI